MLVYLAAAVLFVQAPVKADTVVATRADTARTDSSRAARRAAMRRIPVTPEHLRTAFIDPQARVLLDTARAARLRLDSSLIAYDATTYTRISVGMRVAAFGRDRLAFRMENASRVRWSRDRGLVIDVKGQRMAVPIVKVPEEELEDDMEDASDMAAVPYYPGREPLFFMGNAMAKAEIDDEGFIHPLAKGAEAYYRYETGDSIAIKLGGGRVIRVKELKVRARKPDWKLSVGSLWIDVATGQFVRGVFRLSQQMDIWSVAKEDDPSADEDIPAFVKPLISPMRADIKAITIEYGLYEGRFWLPRVQTADADVQVSFMRVPATFVNTFTYASVNGTDSIPVIANNARRFRGSADSVRADSARRASNPYYRLEDSTYFAIKDSLSKLPPDKAPKNVNIGIGVTVTADTNAVISRARELTRQRMAPVKARQIQQCDTSAFETITSRRYQGTVPVAVRLPCDRKLLTNSADLPKSIYDDGEELFDDASRAELLRALGMGAQSGFAPQRPVVKWGLAEGLLRYNRVEGLAPAVLVEASLGAGYTASALARLGFADWQPSGELAMTRSNARSTLAVAAYRRLAYANLFGDPHTFGASMSALLFARDEGLFYRTLGAEVRGTGQTADYLGWRGYLEQQRSASVHTNLSLARLLGGPRFIGNIAATPGTWAGLESRVHGSRGTDPQSLRTLGDLRLESGFGTTGFMRSYADVTTSRGFPAAIEAALTTSGGIAVGDPPVQKLFFLGGSQTVRGQLPATAAGNLYWLGRGEVGRTFEFVRPTLFFDIGWAGDRFAWKHPGTPLSGAGIGASLLDGMFRVDLARGLQPTQQWRADIYLEARF